MIAKRNLIYILFFVSGVLFAQEDENFYDVLNEKLKEYQPEDEEEAAEGGTYKMYEKINKVWSPRLYPEGNFNIAAKAIGEYYSNYNKNIENRSLQRNFSNIDWTSLGPDKNISNGHGEQVGRIDALAFHPDYPAVKTVYAGTPFGGLWKSTDDGNQWTVANTDDLPIASVSDIAIDATNGENVFISTGIGDLYGFGYTQNRATINPYWTVGIYRSTDGTETWSPINKGLYEPGLPLYEKGGVIRRVISHPTNPNIMYAATSVGIYKTTNALSSNFESVTWELVLNTQIGSSSGIEDVELKGLEFKPDNPNTLYASGESIYRSTDGGATWHFFTGGIHGVNVNQINTGQGYLDVTRINIAVTPADPNRIYAYVVGNTDSNSNYRLVILEYKKTSSNITGEWKIIFTQNEGHEKRPDRLAIAASPLNADIVYFGDVAIHIRKAGGANDFRNITHHNSGFHPDVHAIEFRPNTFGGNNSYQKIAVGHDGGVSYSESNLSYGSNFVYKNVGLNTSLIWAFDDYDFDKDFMIISLQDNGTWFNGEEDNLKKWDRHILEGDGYGVQINDIDNKQIFLKKNSSIFYRYDYELDIDIPETNYRPSLFFPETVKMDQHPQGNRSVRMGFTEIYERLKDEIDIANDNIADIWKRKSDIKKYMQLVEIHRFQITEYLISDKDPNYQYIVTLEGHHETTGIRGNLFRSKIAESCTNQNLNYLEDFNCFEKITSNLPNVNTPIGNFIPVITGIAIDPKNPERIWISFSGYYKTHRVWYSEDAGDTWQNADPNGVLASLNMPANNIVYQEGTNDRLYLATDVGVFTKDADSDWVEYGNLPNVRVTELKINRCNNLLRASTFGRGMWEIDLISDEIPENDYIISENVTLDTEFRLLKNLRIRNNATLTIEPNVEVLIPKTGKIIIEEGSSLFLDKKAFFNSCGECDELVFEVYGTLTFSDELATKYKIVKGPNGVVNLPSNVICNDLEDNILVSGNVTGNFEALNKIYSNGNTATNGNTIFKSGNEIELNPGFSATNQTFTALIDKSVFDCYGGDCDESLNRVNSSSSREHLRDTYIVKGNGIAEENSNIYVSNENKILSFDIYPIPFKDELNFRFFDEVEVLDLKIYNSNGEIVYRSDKLKNNKVILNSKLSSGLYIVSFNINGKNYTKKITKN
ncbi:T9SS type A sorting domain-containing protein [Aureivirga marina]|uniref:T9SS type A sorting domain-containing protein n=1 Tax=Aureivirga marina TaxID=1182451 RepID=UPI0018CB4995|nr:T9SS type A sorting domain-containing protein [Aureivirga marina]